MATVSTIESFLALINSAGNALINNALINKALINTSRRAATHTGSAPLSLHRGETFRLPAGRHVSVVCGRLWLTHRQDSRDHFPRGGESFDTSADSDSVIQALVDSTILVQ